ncbi:unnamed protein product [Rangifer tarandus platyrhynchus]|uniref:Uncharacterized protein n=1 Tax=Rangifer tarandus platyrhynchus TaxID=3082113 RepID=A0AC59ZAX2_RANTA
MAGLGGWEPGHWLDRGLSSLRPSPPGDPSQDLPCSLPIGHQMARLPHQVCAKCEGQVGGSLQSQMPPRPSPDPPSPQGSWTPAAWRASLPPTPIFSFPSSRNPLLTHPSPPIPAHLPRTAPFPCQHPTPRASLVKKGRETDGGPTARWTDGW